VTRHEIEKYERESLIRTGFSFENLRKREVITAQQLLGSSERRGATIKRITQAGETA